MVSWLRDEGATLIGVTWVVLVLSMIASVMLRTVLVTNKNTVQKELQTQYRYDAASAVEVFVKTIFFDPDNRSLRGGLVQIGGTDIRVSVEHEAGKINVNRASEALLSAFFLRSGKNESDARFLAAAVVDWRDRDDESEGIGAEAVEYMAAGRTYGPRNGAFETLGELKYVLGMDDDYYTCVSPYLTVYSQSASVDPYFASETVLETLRWAFATSWMGEEWIDVDLILETPLDTSTVDLGSHSFSLTVEQENETAPVYSQTVRIQTIDDMSFRALTALRPKPKKENSANC